MTVMPDDILSDVYDGKILLPPLTLIIFWMFLILIWYLFNWCYLLNLTIQNLPREVRYGEIQT